MATQSPYEYLHTQKTSITTEIDRLQSELAEIEARISLYKVAKLHRPTEIPESWEPILNHDGIVKGWVEPEFASRRYMG